MHFGQFNKTAAPLIVHHSTRSFRYLSILAKEARVFALKAEEYLLRSQRKYVQKGRKPRSRGLFG